ncbi:MAG TPA: hypothetical protein VIH91_06790 [Terriglobales bacterium]
MHELRLVAKLAIGLLCLTALSFPGFAQEKYETIQANAYGTSNQLGQIVPVTVIIFRFSTPADQGVLVKAFQEGQSQELFSALLKMKAVGRIKIQMPGTVTYDLSFISEVPTPEGRKIRFIANRKIAFGEALADSRSQSFNLAAGEFGVNDQKQSKSTGTIFPATQLIIDPEGQLQFYLYKNPWRLGDIRDANPPPPKP